MLAALRFLFMLAALRLELSRPGARLQAKKRGAHAPLVGYLIILFNSALTRRAVSPRQVLAFAKK